MTEALYQRTDLHSVYLPIDQMLQIDRVLNATDHGIVCEMDLPGHWVFPMHFPNDPIFPGSLLIEAAGQAVAIWGWHHGLRGKPRMAKVNAEFDSPVLISDGVITFKAKIRQRKHICLGTVEVLAQGRKVATIEPVIVVVADTKADLPISEKTPCESLRN